ncbi:helix-turn-helix transcriptional regulator [Kitasatospora sp. YST-16]|uniref:helix-turn-helix domain-containing protein n=1 Tax=Kitasatospora sp. YST-16 TaxID=2998080 RepID=UPI002283AC1F|nr:helix-turn-helix transcriptional regulator [Kitasatospora sp. YST-16]WAL71278.1 helix-turn-helix transcriptional regulator [Kitasatospora sp. YST-16]WNW37315.1 helix-turn-helix transcriptional regulator [Streptomyces sp. Li-HN-5-13]
MSMALSFGAELRRLRQERGLSLDTLAARLKYTKGYLSRVERGERTASVDLVRRCDAVLRADGRLLALVEREDRNDRPGLSGRRELIAAGALSLLALSVPTDRTDRGAEHRTADPSEFSVPVLLRQGYDHARRLGQCVDPAFLLPMLTEQARTTARLAACSRGRTRSELLLLASRFAEFTGWMAQEAGDPAAALAHTEEAVGLAEEAGDPHLASYALVRRALVTFYDNDAARTIDLAAAAAGDRKLPPRIRGLAAQREAQGYALAGDHLRCLRSLEQAHGLLSAAGDDGEESSPVIGTSNLANPAAMVSGWCLYDLGHPREAAELLARECRRIPAHALRTRARYGLRQALAHAAAGEVEQSCAVAEDLLGIAGEVRSATITADVRRLDRELRRFRTNRAVRELQPALLGALADSC